MFLGKHFCRLDKNGQFIPPDEFSRCLTSDLYITQGFDHNLWVLSDSSFQTIYKKLTQLNLTDPIARLLFRLILGSATEVRFEGKGSISISENLREFANLKNEILLIGQGDYFEIWSADLWNIQEAEIRNLAANANRFSAFDITIC
ncbi:MAG TPA: hypothetical protein DCX54_07915 [Flavobacteriales bacterium]|nr:hypothetical protein [Flavobacteriales bacterium]